MAAVKQLPFDLQADLLTVAQAAELAGVSPAVIRQWKRRGHLEPASFDDFGRPLFIGIAVLRAETATRTKARRTYPSQSGTLTNSA